MRGELGPALALVEWNMGGHHETYLLHHVLALVRAGRRLVVLYPRVDTLAAGLRRLGGADGIGGAQLANVVLRELPPPPARQSGLGGMLRLLGWGRSLRRALVAAGGGTVERVHFLCVYEHEIRRVATAVRALGLPWSGLYLHPHAVHRPAASAPGVKKRWPASRLWETGDLRGLLLVDEVAAPVMRERLGAGVKVALMPDFTDETQVEGDELGRRVRAFAGGRPLVGLLGHLLPSKGVCTLARIASRPDADDLRFLFAGEPRWSLFSDAERAELERAAAGAAPTALFHLERVGDEAAYNAAFAACDVIFAVYRDFPYSSNTLTKAAVFEKPVVVSEGHLMARRVREFALGEVVPQDDEAAALAALRRIVNDRAAWRAERRPRWAEYRALHSRARLDVVLGDFFAERGGQTT